MVRSSESRFMTNGKNYLTAFEIQLTVSTLVTKVAAIHMFADSKYKPADISTPRRSADGLNCAVPPYSFRCKTHHQFRLLPGTEELQPNYPPQQSPNNRGRNFSSFITQSGFIYRFARQVESIRARAA